MSLRAMATQIAEDASRLRDRNRLVRDLQEYVGLRDEMRELTEQLTRALSFVEILRTAGVEVATPPVPSAAIQALLGLTPSPNTLIDSPAATLRPHIREVRVWATSTDRSARDAHRAWVDSVLPDLEGVSTLATRLGRLDPQAGAKMRAVVSKARQIRYDTPTSVADLTKLKALAEDIEAAASSFAPSREAKEFLSAVLENGARLELLTPEIKSWADERGFLSSLRVRLVEDPDD